MFYLSGLAGFRPVIEYCGGTEIGGGYISSTIAEPNSPATFSTPAFGLDLSILDSHGQAAEEGELFIVPPSIGLSNRLLNRDHHQTYYADLPLSDKFPVLRRHGDHFRRLANGYFAAGGRADDTMNLGGIKVSSAEIERLLNQTEGVSETAAVSVDTEQGGPSQLHIFAVLDGDVPTHDANHWRRLFMSTLRQQLNPLFKIDSVHLIDHLPRTASNKVMRRKLREQLV